MENTERSEAVETPALQQWIEDEEDEVVSRPRRATGFERYSVDIDEEA